MANHPNRARGKHPAVTNAEHQKARRLFERWRSGPMSRDANPHAEATGGFTIELAPAVEAALAAVNGRASAFATVLWVEVLEVCEGAEALLAKRGVTLRNRAGARVVHTGAGPSAASYRYAAQGTRVTCERSSSGTWRLVEVERVTLYPKAPERRRVVVSEAARADIARAAMDGIEVHPTAAVAAAA